ncbi:MAG: tubulin binding cofactor C-domain-containing protein [Benniella sp.]|nr:MAG: tubulin binding cofactor C-domain-containing protein [Benniella sp.]
MDPISSSAKGTLAEASRDFRTTFDAEKQRIEEAVTGLDKVAKNELQETIDSLVQRIHTLEKTVTENIGILLAYDTRICLEATKSLSDQLSQQRTKLVPKAKFSFKSRKAVSGASSPASLSVSSSPKLAAASSKPASTIDQSLFLKFEDRIGEHLFIGSLAALDSGDKQNEGKVAKDVALTNLTDCTINLVHDIPLGAVHIKNLKRCTLVIPPVSGSILLHDCAECTLIGACHQSRMHTSHNMDIYLHVTSEPIIEDCTDMRFAPYGQILPAEQLDRLFEVAQLNPSTNYYDKVKDFKWLRQQQSPNWRLLEASEIKAEAAQQVLSKDRL